MNLFNRSHLIFLFIAATVVYIFGLFVKVMDVDAAQYASISREMLSNHQYLQVLDRGQDYLDKPPLLFWLSVLSFKIFGVSTVAYKLPSFLFTLLGVYSTYRLARYLYNEETGLLAALIVYTTQAFFLFNNDVRTDTLLTAFVIFACWQLILFAEEKKWQNLILGFIGVALAMMAKGPIGAVVPASALFVHFAMKREWRKFFRWEWIAGVMIVLLLLAPMVMGLYHQFGREGPHFYFWTQSFGRITGESHWDNDRNYFYFFHVFLWSFLPWSFIAAIALLFFIYKVFRSGFNRNALPEYYSTGGFLLPFLALSFSQYKLPHYIFVLYPLAAIFTAAFLLQTVSESELLKKSLRVIQLIVILAVVSLAVIICTLWFPATNFFLWLFAGAGVFICLKWWWQPENKISGIVLPSAMVAIAVNLLLNSHAYPSLLKYQSGSELAKIAREENIQKNNIYFSQRTDYPFEFYFGASIPYLNDDQLKLKLSERESLWLIGGEGLMNTLRRENIPVKKQFSADDFHVTTLNTKFLFRDSRPGAINKIYLVQI